MAYGGGRPDVDRARVGAARTFAAELLPAGRRGTAGALAARSALEVRRSAFFELDCIRDRLSLGTIAAVERRAISLGVGADRVLVANRIIDEESYVIALARWLGWDYESFEHRHRSSCPLEDAQMIGAVRTGMLPLIVEGKPEIVVAPRSVHQLVDYAVRHPRLHFRLASTSRVNGFVADFAAEAIAEHAADSLRYRAPCLSAATRSVWKWIMGAPLLALLAGALVAFTGPTLAAIETMLALFFLSWLTFRLVVCFLPSDRTEAIPISDRDLPIYSIVVALYHEAQAADALISALRALDYPREKLDIKLVIEPDDPETWTALQQLDLGAPFEIIIAPQAGPRTKPKALNAAMPFARGTFTAVYDAEDRPEPDQLRRAVGVFLTGDKDVACVQARLTIDNTRDGWLARLFTAEYAAQFDLFLPGLARMGLPLPLGGSSNHFDGIR